MSLFVGGAVPYSNMVIKGTVLAHNFSTPAALFLFFLFVALVNPLLRVVHPALVLERTELAVVYIMTMVATSIPTIGFSEYVLPIIAGLYYYATPENRWAELIQPHVPRWIAPTDIDAVRYFYEGLPEGVGIPWDAWVVPLSWWCLFILTLFWVSACSMVILRRQWMEHEKLLYPLVQVPLELIEGVDRNRTWSTFLRSPMMWIGFGLPFAIGVLNGLNAYYEFIPKIETFVEFDLFRETTRLRIDLNLALVGFGYLLSRDVAFGFWMFFLLATIERGVFNVLGVHSTETLSRFFNNSGAQMAHQAMGAMIVLVVSGLWMGRHHLRGVLAKAFNGRDPADDSDEIMGYRTAVLGMLGGAVVLAGWLWKSGLPFWGVVAIMGSATVIYLALSRAVVEGGISVLRSPIIPADVTISGLGTSILGASGLAGVVFTFVWAANLRVFFMACFANALKIVHTIPGGRRRLSLAVVLAVLLSMGSSLWLILTMAYTYGGINLHFFFFVFVPQSAFNFVAPKFSAPVPVNWEGWGFTAIGAALMSAFTYMRYRYLWWPLHPLGFATGTFFIMNWLWFSLFVAWLFKTVILKYGGSALYLSTRPFFLGLILGQVVIAGLWLIIDRITGMTGNVIGYF